MKKKLATMPPRVEWDFGNVPPDQYAEATLYEYARESETVRKTICTYLQMPIGGKPRAVKLIQALKKGDIDEHHRIVWGDFSGTVWSDFSSLDRQLLWVITFYPHFPRLFLSFDRSVIKISRPRDWYRPKTNPAFARLNIEPTLELAKEVRQMSKNLGMDEMEYLEKHSFFRYVFRINWRQMTVKDIIKDFAKWLSKEAKNHPELKARGKRGQVSPAPLVWLAALRIHKAGVSYKRAKSILGNDKILPGFNHEETWIRAIKKAERLLRDLETGKRIVDL